MRAYVMLCHLIFSTSLLQGERTFSEEEEEKLQAALSLDKQALSLVVETSAFILEQVVYGLQYNIIKTLMQMFKYCMYPDKDN